MKSKSAAPSPLKSRKLFALTQSGATVSTDRLDYHPGERVTVNGAGWSAGETVTLSFAENPFIDGPHVFTTVATGDGTINDNQFVVDSFDGGLLSP